MKHEFVCKVGGMMGMALAGMETPATRVSATVAQVALLKAPGD